MRAGTPKARDDTEDPQPCRPRLGSDRRYPTPEPQAQTFSAAPRRAPISPEEHSARRHRLGSVASVPPHKPTRALEQRSKDVEPSRRSEVHAEQRPVEDSRRSTRTGAPAPAVLRRRYQTHDYRRQADREQPPQPVGSWIVEPNNGPDHQPSRDRSRSASEPTGASPAATLYFCTRLRGMVDGVPAHTTHGTQGMLLWIVKCRWARFRVAGTAVGRCSA